jgi:hypothetical protein
MKRALAASVSTLALIAAGTATAVTSSHATAPDPDDPIFDCDGTYVNRTFKHVRVPEGATCILRDSTVTGNFRARGPRTVKIIDTEVRRNTMIRGATHDVVIGNAGCHEDPLAGNNIKVTKSHNVAICWMTVKNNVIVRGNDGRIGLGHNDVGRNIDVSRNPAYAPNAADATNHDEPGAIRIKHNVAGGHIRLFDNDPSRGLRGLDTNTPTPEVG